MAQKSQTFNYVCRSCRQHLQKSSPFTRSFSTTPQHKKTIPNFTSTSNAELDGLLSTWRTQVFTPAALTEEHRHLIYRPRRQSILANEPGVTVTLSDGEEVNLKPMKEWQRPQKTKSLGQLSGLLGATNDPVAWGNLPAFLEGLAKANLKVDDWFYQKIARKAHLQRQTWAVVKCADMVERTRYSLATPKVAMELMLDCHMRAVEHGLQGEDLTGIIKQAQHITLLLEKKEHCGGKLTEGQVDARRSLGVIGVLLELEAAKAVNLDGGKDIDGKVSSYVNKALSLSENGFQSHVAVEGQREPPMITKSKNLEEVLPLWNGMRLAMKINGISQGEQGKKLKQKFAELDRLVQKDVEDVRKDSAESVRRSLVMYDALKKTN